PRFGRGSTRSSTLIPMLRSAARSKNSTPERSSARPSLCGAELFARSEPDPVVPAIVQYEPGEQPVTGLTRQHAVARGDIRMPLLMIAQWFEGLRVRDPAAPAHIGERRRKLLLGRRIDIGTRRGADDERRNGGVTRVVEDVGEIEAAARERNLVDEVVGAQRDDEEVAFAGEAEPTLARPTRPELRRRLLRHGEGVGRGRLGRAGDDATHPAHSPGVSDSRGEFISDDAEGHLANAFVNSSSCSNLCSAIVPADGAAEGSRETTRMPRSATAGTCSGRFNAR